ncbi:MAG TPA: polysaccharide biosynthesis C-terminal domain-containing protein, partial [Planctomycetota bacterium]|nr:polysaccharide biosynthesis C-terminal domain-containing protein [Planctomycetota bacterium]
GIFTFHLTLYQLLAGVLDFGAGTIVVREASRDRARAGRLIGMLVRQKAAIAAGGIVLLAGCALWFEGATLRGLLACLAALHLLAHAPSGAAAIFAVDMAFLRPVLAGAIGQTAWLTATLVMLSAGVREPAAYLLAFGAGIVVNGALSFAWAARRVDIRWRSTRAERRALWEEAWPAGVSMSMAAVYFSIDGVMLRPMLGAEAVAHYGAAYRFMGFVLMVPVLFSQVVFPVFSRLWAGGAARLAPFFQHALAVLGSIGLLFPALVWLVSRDLLRLFYPPGYEVAARSLSVLSLSIVLVYLAYPHVLTLLAAGEQRLMMRISVAGAALNIVLNLAAIPLLGIEGAAWTTVITEAFVLACAAAAVRRRTGLRLAWGALRRAAVCAGLSALALALLLARIDPERHALRVAAGLAVGLLAALATGALPPHLGADEGGPLPAQAPGSGSPSRDGPPPPPGRQPRA